jgi:hypothetical protein
MDSGGPGGTGVINIGTFGYAQTITIGNTTGATSLLLQAGTGNIALSGGNSTNYTIGTSSTTGTITVGQSTDTNTINIGNGATASSKTQTINIGNSTVSGGTTIINIGAASSGTNTITIGKYGSGSVKVVLGGDIIKIADTGGKVEICGGYGSTGVTVSAAGNIETNGTLTVDSTSILTGNVTFGGNIVADADENKSIFTTVNNNTITIGGTSSTLAATGALTVGGGYGSAGVSISANGVIEADGNLTVDGDAYIGPLEIGTWPSNPNYGMIMHEDLQYANEYALLQQNNGNTYLNCGAGASTLLRYNGTTRIQLNSIGIGFFGATPQSKTTVTDITNNVTVGGTSNTLTNYNNLSTYSSDAAAIRNNFYQIGVKLNAIIDALQSYGLI